MPLTIAFIIFIPPSTSHYYTRLYLIIMLDSTDFINNNRSHNEEDSNKRSVVDRWRSSYLNTYIYVKLYEFCITYCLLLV